MGILKKVENYTKQALPRRVIDELRPQFKEAKVPLKKSKPKIKPTKKQLKGRQKKQRKKLERRQATDKTSSHKPSPAQDE